MDILGLMKLGDRGSVESRKTPKDVVKKPDGVHREVMFVFVHFLFFIYFLNVFRNRALLSDFAVL